MNVKIKINDELVDATIEIIDGVIVVSPKKAKFEPKDGDVCRSLSCIYIFKTTRVSGISSNEQAIVYHLCYHVNDDELFIGEDVGVGYVSRNNRFATEEEKKLLFDKLDKEGYEWDEEKKELRKKRWLPKFNESYYCPHYHGEFFDAEEDWLDCECDRELYSKGLVFRTKEECQAFCNKLNEAIKQVKP